MPAAPTLVDRVTEPSPAVIPVKVPIVPLSEDQVYTTSAPSIAVFEPGESVTITKSALTK